MVLGIDGDRCKRIFVGIVPLLLGVILTAGPALAQRNPQADRGRTLPALVASPAPSARCTIQDNNSGNALPSGAHGDPLFKLVTSLAFCPQNALMFRGAAKQAGLHLHPTMVGNRGYNNPLPAGSFSFFEAVEGSFQGVAIELGDWFFGHFQTAVNNNAVSASELVEQQQGSQDNLLLESVVWDPTIGMFRFYEIRGTGQGGQWFYRGTSLDIQNDIQNLWRPVDAGQPIFGQAPAIHPGRFGGANTAFRLRCSGCHMDGGPIMKELAAPHDSWWRRERPLPLGAMVIQQEVQNILNDVVDADEFAKWVRAGSDKLFNSRLYMDARSQITLQEQLRPLFCEQEVNLESDARPYLDGGATIEAPVAFFVDPRLLGGGAPTIPIKHSITIDKARYTAALNNFQSSFFDYQSSTQIGIDADHAFEAPVKGRADMALIDALVRRGVIDQAFVIAVLAVDMTRPMFSRDRCGLLALLPERAPPNMLDWLTQFETTLQASAQPAAQELYRNLTDPSRDAAYQQNQAMKLVNAIQQNSANTDPTAGQAAITGYVRLLAQQRIAVFQAQISQHPQGQIFEPVFRLIFPTFQLMRPDQDQVAFAGIPQQYWLNPRTALVEPARP